MTTDKNIPQNNPNGQDAPKHLSERQALELARLACAALLYGEPPLCTFEPADLELAILKLGQMQIERDSSAGLLLGINPSGAGL